MPLLTYRDVESEYDQQWFRYIREHPEYSWDWSGISGNIRLTIETIAKYPELIRGRLTTKSIIYNDSLSMDFYHKFIAEGIAENDTTLDQCHFWEYLSEHPKLTMEDVERYPDRPWSWSSLITNLGRNPEYFHQKFYSNPRFTFVERHCMYNCVGNADWITIDYILEHPNFAWCWSEIAARRDVTLPILTKILPLLEYDCETNYPNMCRNPNLTINYIESHPEIEWCWRELSRNANIPVQTILSTPHHTWGWKSLSSHPGLTWTDVQANPNQGWSWFCLSQHPNITVQTILENPNYPWEWKSVSSNPNLGWAQVQGNLKKRWDWGYLSRNSMDLDRKRWVDRRRREQLAARRIHRFWRDVTSNPGYLLAQRLLIRNLSSPVDDTTVSIQLSPPL